MAEKEAIQEQQRLQKERDAAGEEIDEIIWRRK
jgi:hypothetical protein